MFPPSHKRHHPAGQKRKTWISNITLSHTSRHARQVPKVRQLQGSSGGAKTSAESRRKSNTSSLGTSIIYTKLLAENSSSSLVFFPCLFSRRQCTVDKRTRIHLLGKKSKGSCMPEEAELDGVRLAGRPGKRGGVWRSSRMSRFEPNRGK